MTRLVEVPLDSAHLAKRCAQSLACYVCERDNLRDTELCRDCSAPLALAEQARGRENLPQMIAALGSSGVGKTVYLGMLLDMLSRLPERLQLLARGAFSVTLQQTTAAALARCEFPAKTPLEPDRWDWVHCEARLPRRSHPLEFVIPDMAGESLLAEIDHAHSYQVVRSFLSKANAALILLDAHRLQQSALEEEFCGMKLLTYLGEVSAGAKRGWSARPVAVVFTKADQCEQCFADPVAFAKRHTPGLWRLCAERFERHCFFAAGVAGACTYRRTGAFGGRQWAPLRIEPRGIVEPFEWLVGQLGSQPLGRK